MNLKLLLKWAPDLDPRFRHHPVFNEEFATDSFEAPVVQGSASESESDLFGNEFGESFDEEVCALPRFNFNRSSCLGLHADTC